MENTNDDIQELLNKIKTLNNKEEIEVLIGNLEILIEQQQDKNSVYLNQLKEEVRRLSSLWLRNPVDIPGFLFYFCTMKEDNKYLGYFIWIIFFIIMATLIFNITTKIKNNNLENEKQKNELKVDSVPQEKIEEDTIVVEQTGNNLWPIKVVSVEKYGDPKWVVTTENGVMYYTNKKPKVGDIAFYINDNDDITDKNGRVEVTRQ